MIKTVVLVPLITRVPVIREVVIKNAGGLMLYLMVKVNISFSIKIMVGGVIVGEVLMLLSNISNVGYLVIMLQSVLH